MPVLLWLCGAGGMDRIIAHSGIDATADFSAQHGLQSPQASILATYYIGDLAESA